MWTCELNDANRTLTGGGGNGGDGVAHPGLGGLVVACFDAFGDDILLCDRQDVVGHPVQDESSGEPQEEKRKRDRHDFHDFRLHGVWRCWVQHLLNKHASAHQQGQDKVRVFDG